MHAAKPKKLKAEIVAEVSFSNYVEAADHQVWLEAFLRDLREEYPEADLVIRETRETQVEANPGDEVRI